MQSGNQEINQSRWPYRKTLRKKRLIGSSDSYELRLRRARSMQAKQTKGRGRFVLPRSGQHQVLGRDRDLLKSKFTVGNSGRCPSSASWSEVRKSSL